MSSALEGLPVDPLAVGEICADAEPFVAAVRAGAAGESGNDDLALRAQKHFVHEFFRRNIRVGQIDDARERLSLWLDENALAVDTFKNRPADTRDFHCFCFKQHCGI